MDEFALIRRHFGPLAATTAGSLDLRDDAALLDPPAGETLVLTLDTLVAGVHYLPDDPADSVAQKLLRVSLSDLAAMGARPVGYLLSVSLPRDVGEDWLAGFAGGLRADQERFGLGLLGGDTTATPGPANLSATLLGTVPKGRALRRGGAAPGEAVYVSGSLGEATVGLELARGGLPVLSVAPKDSDVPGIPFDAAEGLIARYRCPAPRLALGRALLADGLATAAVDVSDGLVADLDHLLAPGGLGATVALNDVPLSAPLCQLAAQESAWLPRFVSGGDDYELLFTAPPDRAEAVAALAQRLALPLTRIGTVDPVPGVRLHDAHGVEVALAQGGWSHFTRSD